MQLATSERGSVSAQVQAKYQNSQSPKFGADELHLPDRNFKNPLPNEDRTRFLRPLLWGAGA